MDEQPLIDRWSDAETWLRSEARHCTIRRELPASVAFAFHDGQASALIETPTFSVEDADLITDELCRFLPRLQADQLLVMGPGAYDLEQDAGPCGSCEPISAIATTAGAHCSTRCRSTNPT